MYKLEVEHSGNYELIYTLIHLLSFVGFVICVNFHCVCGQSSFAFVIYFV